MENFKSVPVINEEPLISVIIPVYNVAPYLGKCIDSVLKQEYQNLEIIIVNDGSSDKSGAIIEEYVKKYSNKIKSIHQDNMGVTSARLNGFKIAEGEWISFIDADDTLDKNMYQKLIDNALNYKVDISHCGYKTILNNGKIHYLYNTGKVISQSNYQGLYDLISGEFIEPGLCNKLYKKRVIEAVITSKKLDYNIKYNEDLMMNFLLFKEAKASIYEDFCPYNYYARNGSATRMGFNIDKLKDPIEVSKWILNSIDDSLMPVAWNRYMNLCLNAYIQLYKFSDYKDYTKNLKKEIKDNIYEIKKMGIKSKIKYLLVFYTPHLFEFIHFIYSKLFLENIYE